MSVSSSMRKEQLVNVLEEALAEQVVLEEQVLHALTPAGFPAHDFERTRPQAQLSCPRAGRRQTI